MVCYTNNELNLIHNSYHELYFYLNTINNKNCGSYYELYFYQNDQ